ncbi:MAG: hypothetical protein ACKV22_19260 [Bryobacteraceae bacterium]
MNIRRREWLLGLAAKVAAAERLVKPAAAPVPGIIEIGSVRQPLLDDYLIHEASKINPFVPRPTKYAKNPILVEDRDWERGALYGDTHGVEITGQTAIYDEDEKIFKIWYLGNPWPDQRRPLCLAVSHDGYTWEKPNVGVYEYKGSKKNNILGDWADPQFFNVIKDPRDPDPARRYKAMGELEGPVANQTGGVAVAFSPDGLHWTLHPGNPVVRHGRNVADAPTMLGWDPRIERFVGFYRPGHPLAPEIYGTGDHRHIRSYGYSTSADFIHWTPTELMMTPDQEDRGDYQYMQFTAGIHGQFYIGFNAMYETHEQTWDVFLMSSRDGFHWNWLDRKVPFLGRGEVGTYDAGYMTPSGPIVHKGQAWIYYGAFAGAHSYNASKLGKDIMSIALCTLPENRWMGLLAGPSRGTLVTRPLLFKGNRLFLDLDASLSMQKPEPPKRRFDECELRGALEDQSGGRIDGFSLDRSTVIVSSGEQELAWEGARVGQLAGKPVRLRLEYRNAAVYSFQFR